MNERNEIVDETGGPAPTEESKPADQQPSDQGDGATQETASVDEPAVVGE